MMMQGTSRPHKKNQIENKMNIFYLHPDPEECAKMHADKHVVKMILETAQLLSTAHRVLDGVLTVVITTGPQNRKRAMPKYVMEDPALDAALYAATHVNHPSAKWARASRANYEWLHRLFAALLAEYSHRYGGKTHASQRLLDVLAVSPRNVDADAPFEEPWPAMPDEFKVSGDSVASYRGYYLGAKAHLLKWKNRAPPAWVTATDA